MVASEIFGPTLNIEKKNRVKNQVLGLGLKSIQVTQCARDFIAR